MSIDETLAQWQGSNQRLSLVHLLVDEARKLKYSDEEHEDRISNYSMTAKAMADRDEIWRLYFKASKDSKAKEELTSKIKNICQ